MALNPIRYFKLDEASGGAIDAVGGNNLSAAGTPGTATGVLNGARDLVGSQYFYSADNVDFDFGTGDFALSAWIKLGNPGVTKMIAAQWDGSTGWLIYVYTNNILQFETYEGGAGNYTAADGTTVLGTTSFYHVVVQRKSGVLEFYVNSVAEGGGSGTVRNVSNAGTLYLGFFSGGAAWTGQLDEFGLYNHSLTQTEINTLYGAGTPPSYPYSAGGLSIPVAMATYRRLEGRLMKLLKQSTAKVIQFGPFLSPSDGVTLVTSLVSALDHGTTGIFLSKAGGALTIRNATVTASSYDAYGNYLVTLDTTDTATLGNLRVQFAAAASCLPVWDDFMVVPANVYDSLVAGSDLLDTNAAQLIGTAPTEGAGGRLAGGFTKFFNVASPTGTVNSIPDAVAGAAGGLTIAGSNAATTFATLTVTGAVAFQSTFAVTTSTSLAALSATTVTFSGAVAFQSTFAVTTSTSLAALSCTTLTASGAVAFQSTFGVTGTTTLAAVTTTGTVTLNALTVTNATTLSGAVSLGSTLGVTGTATFAAVTTTGTVTMNALTVTNATTLSGAVSATSGSNDIRGCALTTADKQALIELTFTYDATATYGTANAGSLVAQIADNAGGSALTTDAICEAMFTYDATATYLTANAGSVVKQIADNAGGSALTVQDIVDGVLNEAKGVHTGLLAKALPDVVPGNNGGLLIAGSNAATTFASLTVTTTTTFTGAVACNAGVTFTSSTGDAFTISSSVGKAVSITTTSPTTVAIAVTSISESAVLLTSSGGNGHGLSCVANGTGHGFNLQGGTNGGDGLHCTGGDSGDGFHVQAGSGSNARGFHITGGGTTGDGILIETTAGDGIKITPTAGNAITATANGTSKHGIQVTGGTAGTSDGLKLVAGSGGVGFRLDTLTASGAVTLSSTLTVTGATTFTGAITATNASNDVRGIKISGTITTLDGLDTSLSSAHGSGSWLSATGFSTHSAADVWSVATRVLTAGTNIVLAKGVGVTGFNDIAATAIVSGGAITTSSGAVTTVTTTGTVTNPVTAGTVSDKTGYALSTAGVQAIWDAATSALTSVGSVGKLIVDAIAGSRAEPGQGAPPASATFLAKIDWLFKSWRNLKTNDGTTTNLYNDAGSVVDQKQTTSSVGGTVSKGEWSTGP